MEPEPPEDVKLVRSDGMVIPLDCVYEGFINGAHLWKAMAPEEVSDLEGFQLKVRMLPAHTGIRLEFNQSL